MDKKQDKRGLFRSILNRNSDRKITDVRELIAGVNNASEKYRMDITGWMVAYEPKPVLDDWTAVTFVEYPAAMDVNEVQADEHALLDSSGIAYRVRFLQKKIGTRFPKTYYAMQTFVPHERADEACELLNREELQTEYEIDFDGFPQITCPECGETHDMDFPKCPECGHRGTTD